ncbi:MAG: NAD(P)-dependent oxidoreductase [Xanthomonadaceae bacterium]|nr:NAD(P)-dependent oxidoreductase [Xanthomonadaceae bacterium]MDP2184986.1 NAD(P)-dependent oxidoreductase [Xanthomonadales bacterium]MDZ4117337.1 NAD(P)-dependent oxidoreductase [Xanthomonadaceae bacterium]MDZ4377668.1 NAD(P)-dependent oxidoreductase [Xanthomonadaceae bacterium]
MAEVEIADPGKADSGKADSDKGIVALTGATGFVGKRLQARLLESGYRVRALVRPGSPRTVQMLPGCEAIALRLDDAIALRDALADVSALVYCAGSVRGRVADDFRAANVHGVQHVIEALQGHGQPPPLLLVSSLAASRPHISDYALTKHEGEVVLHSRLDLPWTIMRPPALYGPGDQEMLPLLRWLRRGVAPVTGPLNQRLSLLHVDDFADAVYAWLAEPSRCHHQTYAIDDGTPGGYDWAAMGRAVAGRPVRLLPVPASVLHSAGAINGLLSLAFGYAPMLTPGKVRELRQAHWLADNRTFQAATGWQPMIDLATGTQRLFAPPHID